MKYMKETELILWAWRKWPQYKLDSSPYLGINIQGVTVFNNVPVHMLQIQTHLYKDRGERWLCWEEVAT